MTQFFTGEIFVSILFILMGLHMIHSGYVKIRYKFPYPKYPSMTPSMAFVPGPGRIAMGVIALVGGGFIILA